MRAHESIPKAAYSYATMYSVTPELRLKTEIRSLSTQFFKLQAELNGSKSTKCIHEPSKIQKIYEKWYLFRASLDQIVKRR